MSLERARVRVLNAVRVRVRGSNGRFFQQKLDF